MYSPKKRSASVSKVYVRSPVKKKGKTLTELFSGAGNAVLPAHSSSDLLPTMEPTLSALVKEAVHEAIAELLQMMKGAGRI